MKISVAIPTYNRAEIIAESINAILSQSYPVDQIIVVDDGSTDNTEQVVREISENIIYKKIKNSGPAEARRQAIAFCDNEWVALCDSDDLWFVNHIENFIAAIKAYPVTTVYFSNFIYSNATNSTKFLTSPDKWWDSITSIKSHDKAPICQLKNDAYIHFFDFQPVFPTVLIFSKPLYDDIGGIARDLPRINSEDAHIIRRLVAYGETSCSFEPTVQILKHDDNYSADIVKNIVGRLAILHRIHQYKEVPVKFMQPTFEEIQKSIPLVIEQLHWHKRYQEAVNLYKMYKSYQPTLNLKLKIKYLICLLRK
jgi:glycosyltransferase involved in cell wall biosynthesis